MRESGRETRSQMERMVPVPVNYPRRRRHRTRTHISSCLKYTMFFFNFVFWVSVLFIFSHEWGVILLLVIGMAYNLLM